jgi:hypothetical protein
MESVSSLLASLIAGILWSTTGSGYVFLFSALLTVVVIMQIGRLRED